MDTAQVTHLTVKRSRRLPLPDFSGFFLFFGVSGTDWNRDQRLERRFEREYYQHLVTLRLGGRPTPGRYHLRGLPPEADRRGWTVGAGGTATARLSDEGVSELRAWMDGGAREVGLERLG